MTEVVLSIEEAVEEIDLILDAAQSKFNSCHSRFTNLLQEEDYIFWQTF
jgi:predicted oxidoreductase (fatty acid repression mutant protein)